MIRLWPRNAIAEELKATNFYLALIAEILQNPYEPHSQKTPPMKKQPDVIVPKVEFPPSFVDAMELLARRLWIDLPEESKEDLADG